MSAGFPVARPRRLRRTAALRRLVSDVHLTPGDLVLPLLAVAGHLLVGAPHEVPPHDDRLVERLTSEHQEPDRLVAGRQYDRAPPGLDVRQLAGLHLVPLETQDPLVDEEPVLVAGVDVQLEPGAGVQVHLGADDLGEGRHR